MTTKLTFWGAAETVTGSRFLLEKNDKRLLVDCGLFQGVKKIRIRNRQPFPVDPKTIDAIVLTHAHLDHSGFIPALCNEGFQGNVYCTPATLDLCRILLPDAGHLQEEEAERANRHGYTKHKPAIPLYTENDAYQSLSRFIPIAYHQPFQPTPGFTASMTNAGHILGAACVHVNDGEKTVAFSGDVGRNIDPIMKPPEPLQGVDYLVLESTYGDRRHPEASAPELLEKTINSTFQKGGVVLIPTFAVGRAQSLLHVITRLMQEGRIPKAPIYLDSPMAIDATDIFLAHRELHKLSEEECHKLAQLVTFTPTVEQSKAIEFQAVPKIILSASGMLTGGRVLHHLKLYLDDQRNTIIFVGFQAEGTRGSNMLAGMDRIRIHGEYFPVRANLVSIECLSAHADYVELTEWISKLTAPPAKTYLVHGEAQSQDAFRSYLENKLNWQIEIPVFGESVTIG